MMSLTTTVLLAVMAGRRPLAAEAMGHEAAGLQGGRRAATQCLCPVSSLQRCCLRLLRLHGRTRSHTPTRSDSGSDFDRWRCGGEAAAQAAAQSHSLPLRCHHTHAYGLRQRALGLRESQV